MQASELIDSFADFAKQKNNERTLIFAAFTAEEVGGYGSKYFHNNLILLK